MKKFKQQIFPHSQRGFTLLEILIAMFIISIIAIIMVRGLQIVISTKNDLERNETQLQRLDLAMSLIASDMRSLINRPFRISNNPPQPPLQLQEDAFNTLEFTRGGVSNPLAELRSTGQHAAYQLKNGKLVRLTWPVLDPLTGAQPEQRELLGDVAQIKWQFLGADNRFYPAWPTSEAANQPLPKAVQLTLTIDKLGTITQLFVVANQIPPTTNNNN